MIHIFRSQKLEDLAARMAHILVDTDLTCQSFWQREVVLLESFTRASWLKFYLAEYQTSTLDFQLPAQYLWSLARRCGVKVSAQSPFDHSVFAWRLYEALARWESAPPEVAVYQENEVKRLQLALRLSQHYNKYLVHRQMWLANWQLQAPTETLPWQGSLWRHVFKEGEIPNRHPLSDLVDTLHRDKKAREHLPSRLWLFAPMSMAPFYFEIYKALATWVDIHWLIFSPSREYWSKLTTLAHTLSAERQQAAVYFETDQGLLGQQGRAPREFLDALLDCGAASDEDAFAETPATTLLHQVQQKWMTLDNPTHPVLDDTIEVHSCYGALREVETVHRLVAGALAADEALKASDILILTTSMDVYAAPLRAVFSHSEPALPISLPTGSATDDLTRTFLEVLDVAGGRLPASKIWGLLEQPLIVRGWKFSPLELSQLRHWLVRAKVRWGSDAMQHESLGLPATSIFTWQWALDRLYLGHVMPYAMPEDEEKYIVDDAPLAVVDEVEGNQLELLARFHNFFDVLHKFAKSSTDGKHSARTWQKHLVALINGILPHPENLPQGAAPLLQQVEKLVLAIEAGGLTDANFLPWEIFRSQLIKQLSDDDGTEKFGGNISILPLRSGSVWPAKVVVVMGLSDNLWPHIASVDPLDMMAEHPLPSDPNPRDEEQYAFLEACCAARHRLILTFSGRQIQNNTAISPSSSLSLLLEGIKASHGKSVCITQQSLHPFVVKENAPAAKPWQFFPAGAQVKNKITTPLEISTLARFFSNPCRAFLKNGLGIQLTEGRGILEDVEPFTAKSWEINEALFHAGADEKTIAGMQARGLLPEGSYGRAWAQAAWSKVPTLRQRLGNIPPFISREIKLSAPPLVGRIQNLTGEGILYGIQFGNFRPSDLLSLWINYLALCASDDANSGACFYSVEDERSEKFRRPENAKALLADIYKLYDESMRSPLFFMPHTAWHLARHEKWRDAWEINTRKKGESQDPYVRLAFSGWHLTPEKDMQHVAEKIFSPLLKHLVPKKNEDDGL